LLLDLYLRVLSLDYSEIKPNHHTLSIIQKQHLLKFPYQNLRYFQIGNDWITFDDPQQLVKLTISGSVGGTCCHLNYSLYWLLNKLGFNCTLISGKISRTDMDHMIMIVELDQPYLVDVGFGEFFFIRPVPLSEEVIEDISGAYRVVIDEETGKFMLQQKRKEHWRVRYSFDLNPRTLNDFEETYRFLSENESHFNNNIIFTKYIKNGFISLYNNKLTIIEDGIVRRIQIPWENVEPLFSII
jgi:N-hydroxyarylamine O-acetyltransferase